MPIVMKLKDNRSCPTIICEVCRQEIRDAKDGNAQWMMGEEEQDSGATLYFTHKRCCQAFDKSAHQADKHPGAQELAHFMVYLSNNLQLNWDDARKGAAILASLE